MRIGPYKLSVVYDDDFDENGPPSFEQFSDLDAGPTIPDELTRIWDSEIAILSDQELADASEFCDDIALLDHDDQISAELSDVCEVDHELLDYEDTARAGLSDPQDDPDLEVALEECPFDVDTLLDNVR